MTIRDLISELEQFDDNQQVVIKDDDYIHEIRNVAQRKIIATFGDDNEQYICLSAGIQIGGVQ
ncbi:MAG: hypothetical protein IJV31_00990 [Clostridia bacterium]|nr:hypothetical protein [Clostridia bacterium]MBQ9657326.1 hypothetical protein [Clostridia bacterium]